jgi:hypothetical protein
VVGEKVLIFYIYCCENKRKERVFLSLIASQLTSRYLTTNPATLLALLTSSPLIIIGFITSALGI